ncbi:MAG: hypothetical protein OWQ54_10240 [Sulfolobaceae archaeon]|nr:hypothetical protein [Sulfolobaceae archaeon]
MPYVGQVSLTVGALHVPQEWGNEERSIRSVDLCHSVCAVALIFAYNSEGTEFVIEE